MPNRCLAVVVALIAITGGSATVAEPMQKMDGAGNPADQAFMGAMSDMMSAMHRDGPTGNTDADFVRMMLPHHQAAVDMAKAELQYGKDETLKQLAKDIIAAQDKEIALMKAWEDKQKSSH